MTNSFRIHRPCFTTHADGSEAVLTIHEITGRGDGPTIGISGAIHGNEPTGTEIILELYRVLQNTPIRGRLLLLPVANPRAYAQNRRFTPIDELNLNREFPGDPGGTYTQQLAAAITREFLEVIDVHLDFHSGTDRPTVDYVYIWTDEALSRSFGSTSCTAPSRTGKGRPSPAPRKWSRSIAATSPSWSWNSGAASSTRNRMSSGASPACSTCCASSGSWTARSCRRRSRPWSARSRRCGRHRGDCSRPSHPLSVRPSARAGARPDRQPLHVRGPGGDSDPLRQRSHDPLASQPEPRRGR